MHIDAPTIYETIMKWLAGQGNAAVPASNRDILSIPFHNGATTRVLKFRRVVLMGGGSYAQSLDNEAIKIQYDPNWDVLTKIEQLLA